MTYARLKKLILLLSAVIVLAGLFSSCSNLLEREYKVMSPHVEQRADDEEEAWHLAETYAGLKNVIIKLVRLGEESAVIRLYRYEGDISEDISRAVNEVMREEPIGAYAVDYIPYEPPVRFPAYYEVKIRLNYRRTTEEISAIRTVSDSDELTQALASALTGFKERLVVETASYNNYSYDITAIINEIYYTNPDVALGIPEIKVEYYPNAGFRRIVDITLAYRDDTDGLIEKKEQLDRKAADFLKGIRTGGQYDTAAAIYEKLFSTVSFDTETAKRMEEAQIAGRQYYPTESADSFTAYGALEKGLAAPEGYALAVKLLCGMKDIECVVVSGFYGGYRHYWNLIKLDGEYYHLDAAMEKKIGSGENFFLRSDAALPAEYLFNTAAYPKCRSTEYDPIDIDTTDTTEEE